MTALLLRIIQRAFIGLAGLAAVLILFTAMQSNLRGAGLLAVLALAFSAAARAVGWVLAGFVGSDGTPSV